MYLTHKENTTRKLGKHLVIEVNFCLSATKPYALWYWNSNDHTGSLQLICICAGKHEA